MIETNHKGTGYFIARQGDVILLAAGSIPGDAKPVERDANRVVLAYGEVTGHAHAILDADAELVEVKRTNERFLRVLAEAGVTLSHEEHSAIVLPPGNYEVRIQREYDLASGQVRNVQD